MSRIIAISSNKGGVGKTTTAVNLAACLAAAEKKTLLVDFDSQGNASAGVGLSREEFAEKNVYYALIGNIDIREAIYKTQVPYLDICPADSNLAGAEIELVSVLVGREFKLQTILENVRDDYEYIIIDCSPNLGILTINALCASDRVIVPLQTEFFAMDGLTKTLNLIQMLQTSIRPNLIFEGILYTMFDSRNNLHKQVCEEVKKHYTQKVFSTVIPKNITLSECPSFGLPVILYDISSKGSQAYLSFARELIVRYMNEEKELNGMQEAAQVH